MAVGGLREQSGNIAPAVIVAQAVLKRRVRNGSPGSSFSRQPSRLCSRPATKSLRAERIVDHMRSSRPSASGLRSRPCRLSHQTGRQMKSQPYQVSSTSLNRSETFPMRFVRRGRVGDRCLRDVQTWPAPATEARRHWPRLNNCGLRRAMRRGHARGRHQWRRLPFFWAGSIFAEQRGSRGFGSVKPL